MKNYIKRKPYGSPRKTHSPRGSADSPYLQANGNSNGYKRNGKNSRDQYNDYLNKAKDAKSQGDEVLEQFFLQHAEHYFRLLDNSNKVSFSRKITNKENLNKEPEISDQSSTKKDSSSTDFDDLASQLA